MFSEQCFQLVLKKLVLIFIDDVLVYSETLEKHGQHLRIVLQTLREHQLYVGKCYFYQDQIQYLGHVISKEGIYC